MDKLVVALIAAPVGALCGFLGAAAMEFIKRRLSHIDDLHELCDELTGDLSDLSRAVDRGVRPTRTEMRSLLKQRRQMGIQLERLFLRKPCWPPLKAALDRVDHTIEVLDELALDEGEFEPVSHSGDDAAKAIDAALRTAAGTDGVWKLLRGR